MESVIAEVETAEKNANFERRKSILRGMLKAYKCAHQAVISKFNTNEDDE